MKFYLVEDKDGIATITLDRGKVNALNEEMVAALGAGLLRIGQPDGSLKMFALWGGFLRVGDDKVNILVDRAVGADDVDAAGAKKELDETLEALRHPRSDEEFEEAEDQGAGEAEQRQIVGFRAPAGEDQAIRTGTAHVGA